MKQEQSGWFAWTVSVFVFFYVGLNWLHAILVRGIRRWFNIIIVDFLLDFNLEFLWLQADIYMYLQSCIAYSTELCVTYYHSTCLWAFGDLAFSAIFIFKSQINTHYLRTTFNVWWILHVVYFKGSDLYDHCNCWKRVFEYHEKHTINEIILLTTIFLFRDQRLERMEAMEKQIASLTGLVQSVLTRAPDSDST